MLLATDRMYRVSMSSLHKPPARQGWTTGCGSGYTLMQTYQHLHNNRHPLTLSFEPDPELAQVADLQSVRVLLTS